MNEKVTVLKPEPIKVTLDDQEYSLYYDLNAFCEMEKIYDSVDTVLQMLLGTTPIPDLEQVTYCGAKCLAADIEIAGVPLTQYISRLSDVRKAKHSDTLNLLWLGCLHDHTEFDADGNVVKYTITKAKLGSMVTFANLRDVNSKIVTSMLRDLMPAVTDALGKNAEQAEAPILQVPDNQAQ